MSVPESDWLGRARREAAVILAGAGVSNHSNYPELVSFVAVGWLQGAIYGSHCTLEHAEDAFAAMRAELT